MPADWIANAIKSPATAIATVGEGFVDAWFLRALFDSVYVVALAIWVGSLGFFTFGVAPIADKRLGPEACGRFVQRLLPRCYLWGTVCGAIALPAAMGVPLSFPEYRAPRVGLQALAILAGTLTMLYAGNSLTPRLHAAREAGPEMNQVGPLMRRLTWLNWATLAMVIGLLVAFANRPAPRTAGIVELTPQQRARREADAWRAKAEKAQTPRPNATRP